MEAGVGGGLGSIPAATAAAATSPPPFLSKTYDMVDDPATDAVVSWSKTNNSFVVWNVPEFTRDLLPKYFKHNNFSSFVRQLNTYGFRKVDPDRWEFANEGFLRGQKHLLKTISRRKPTHAQSQSQQQQQPTQVQTSPSSSCIEVGKFGIEEEVERLKRDKNILMQELVRLRQQQQTSDHRLQTVGQRVHMMEQRQQQMMSFLAKAMQSPGFVAQLVHHNQNDSNTNNNINNSSNRQISGGNKKRRLPNQDEEKNLNLPQPKYSIDGKMVKYQPQMNEAAKSMLRQILKMDPSGSRLDSKSSNMSGFLIDNVHPPPPDLVDSSRFSEVQVQSPEANTILPDFVTESLDMGYVDAIPGFVDTPIVPAALDEVLLADDDGEGDGDILLDDMPKLPGINDVFWEQFLDSPLTGDTDEIISNVDFENSIGKDQVIMEQEGEWNKMMNLNSLTEQMGLLASASKIG